MADAEMKTSHFPSIPFVASRDPTMARCRVRHVSIGTLETSCHRSDSRSRNSSDPFPELSPKSRQFRLQLRSLLFSGIFHTSSGSRIYGRSFSIDRLVPLRDGNDYNHPIHTICHVSATTWVRVCISAVRRTMGNDKGARYQLEAQGNVIFYILSLYFAGFAAGFEHSTR